MMKCISILKECAGSIWRGKTKVKELRDVERAAALTASTAGLPGGSGGGREKIDAREDPRPAKTREELF